MKNYRFLYLTSLIGILALFQSCRSQSSASRSATLTPEPPTEKSLLWKISGNGLKKPSYLFGTIHLIEKDEFELSQPARTAFDQVERVAFEIDMKEMTNLFSQFSLITKAFMRNGTTLRELLPEQDYAYVHEKLKAKGLSNNIIERLKPLFLSALFSTDEPNAGTSELNEKMTSVEMELYRMARRRKYSTAGLETTAYQMSMFDSIPYRDQAQMLVETLRSSEGAGEESEYDQMIKLYLAQDIQAMQNMVTEEKSGMNRYEDVLLNRRNSNWIPVMRGMMREKSTFFAVGAGHLAGPKGVIALLRLAGFKVEAVLQ